MAGVYFSRHTFSAEGEVAGTTVKLEDAVSSGLPATAGLRF